LDIPALFAEDEPDLFLFRDRFTPDADPLATGDGRTVTGTWYSEDGALRGGATSLFGGGSAAWGDARVLWETAITRSAGRTLMARVTPIDPGAPLWFGLLPNTSTSDPRAAANAHGWLFGQDTGIHITEPGNTVQIAVSSQSARPTQYLVAHVLRAAGCITLVSGIGEAGAFAGNADPVGIPTYPQAKVLWATQTGSVSTLYAGVYATTMPDAYPGGHCIEDVRVLDADAYAGADALTTAYDDFARADSATTLGSGWNVDAGTWGITGGAAYVPSGSGFVRAWRAGSADGMLICDLTVPTTPSNGFGVIVRRQDADNYVRIWNDGDANKIQIATWVGGSFGANIYTTGAGINWVAGQTYRLVVKYHGNRYRLWIDGVAKSDWETDANSRFLTATGVGLLGLETPTGARWDNFACYPSVVTLAAALQRGSVPDVWAGGAVIGQDTFTDTDGTALTAHTAESGGAWTVHGAGTWAISGNAAEPTGTTSATQAYSTAAVEVEGTLRTAAFNAALDSIFAGVLALHNADGTAFYGIRAYMDPTQLFSDELELTIESPSLARIVKKVNIGNYWQPSSDYVLRMQARGRWLHVFLNGGGCLLSYRQTGTVMAGTHAGMYAEALDDGTRMSGITVKVL
jgi:hypothetical protein